MSWPAASPETGALILYHPTSAKLALTQKTGEEQVDGGTSTDANRWIYARNDSSLGDYGLRMKDHDRRVSAKQLGIGEDTIRKRLRGLHYKLYTRVSANIGVYTHGNEVRMGKGKGKFDYWASRIPVSRVVFELKGEVHEKVVRDAFRLAGNKLPGLWEFVKRGDPPMVGITKLGKGVTLESLKEARREVAPKEQNPQAIIPPTLTDQEPTTVSASL